MPHPGVAKLTQYAISECSDAALEWHVGSCGECAAEVEGLRAALDDLRATEAAAPPVHSGCLDEHQIAGLAVGELPGAEREPHLSHLAECAVCRRAVASVASALASDDVRDELAYVAHRNGRRWMRLAIPLGAAAALLLLLVSSDPPAVSPPHRSSPGVSPSAPVGISPSGPTTTVRSLRWHSAIGADRYQVTLFDGDGSVLWESTLPDTVISVPDGVPLEPGRVYYWIVAARTGFDRWETSALVEFSIAPDPLR